MRNLLWAAVITGLSACQPVAVRHQDNPAPVTMRVDDGDCRLEDWQRTVALPEEQLVQALRTSEREFEHSDTPETRVCLALLLAEGPQPVRNQTRALDLLTGLDPEQASDHTRALAALLRQVIEEQRWFVDKMAELNRKLETSRTHAEALELQLQELTTIEKNIQQREIPGS